MIEAALKGRLGAFVLDATFEAPSRGVTALFGPSGCGKTTILRCLAGLTRLPGRVCVDGTVWQDPRSFVPVHRRGIGYVFQEPSLFAHLSVRQNLRYGARRAARRGAGVAIGQDEVIGLLGIGPLLERGPHTLSGGERQRVAIGRALLSQPRLLLMDEPLAALDRFSKDEILPYLERLRDDLSVPLLYVSHDIAEVERLADHLVLLRAGAVVAQGALAALQSNPNLPLAGLPEAGVTVPARIAGHEPQYGLTRLALDGADLLVPGDLRPKGATRRVRIAASDVSLAREATTGSTILNIVPARILSASPQQTTQMMVVLAFGAEGTGARLLARISRRSWDMLSLQPGQTVYAQIKGVALAEGRLAP